MKGCTGTGTAIRITTVFTLIAVELCHASFFNEVWLGHRDISPPCTWCTSTNLQQRCQHMTWSKMWCCFWSCPVKGLTSWKHVKGFKKPQKSWMCRFLTTKYISQNQGHKKTSQFFHDGLMAENPAITTWNMCFLIPVHHGQNYKVGPYQL